MDEEWQHKIRRLKRRRWLIWIPAAVAFLAAYFHRTSTGVVADKLMGEFAIEQATDLGFLASIYFYTYAVLQIPAGIMADTFGQRRMITGSLLVSAAGAAIFAWADSLAGLYVGRFIASFGVALIFVNIIKIQAAWFRPKEFASVSGLLVLVGNAGSLLAATPLAFIVDALGWRTAFQMIAAYSLIMAFACWVTVRNSPEEVGLPAVSQLDDLSDAKIPRSPSLRPPILSSMKTVLCNKHSWAPSLVSAAIFGVHMSFIGAWGIPYLMQVHEMSRVEASNHVLAMVFGNMIGAPFAGWLSDRIGYRQRPYIGLVIFFLMVWMTLACWNDGKPPAWVMYPLCLSMGIGMSTIVLTVACVKEINPPNMTGIAAGIANSGPFIGAAIMQPAFGWVLDRYWEGAVDHGVRIYPLSAYQHGFFLCIAVIAVGLILTFGIRETYCRQST